MPTYTYQCDNCGIRFDQFQHFSDAPLTICPECGDHALRKVYQPVGIVFKGKGFYATDNRSPSGQSYASEKENGSKKDAGDNKTQSKTTENASSENKTND